MVTPLFTGELIPRQRRELAPGAYHVPDWLSLEKQHWIADQFRVWAAGPVPPRSARVGAHLMSVRTVCLGWHWRPNQYSREAIDVNGNRVLDFPNWLVRLGRSALEAARGGDDPAADENYTPDTALANYYDSTATMGMHQDKDERALAPVVSISIGDSCVFRFGNSENRNRPFEDLELRSGDLFVFGGASRLAFHGVQRIYPGTAPDGCGLATGRINITLRETGLSSEQ